MKEIDTTVCKTRESLELNEKIICSRSLTNIKAKVVVLILLIYIINKNLLEFDIKN